MRAEETLAFNLHAFFWQTNSFEKPLEKSLDLQCEAPAQVH